MPYTMIILSNMTGTLGLSNRTRWTASDLPPDFDNMYTLVLKNLLFSLIIANCFVSVAEFVLLDDIQVFALKPP
jgi:hypothetical protein